MADRVSFERSSSEAATSPGVPPTASSGAQGNEVLATRTSNERYEIGINTLLTRLKQSVASARLEDFATFLKKRSTIEEDHAQALKKLTRTAFESTRRPDSRQGSYARNYEEITRIHDRMADNGIQFALSLHQMHEDLTELSLDKEKGRKLWKQNGLSAEKRVQDAETAMDKAKSKYNSLAEDYDRARTGDKQSGRFGLKGPKSAAQIEEDLHRKMQAADSDYSSKVQTAQTMRQELLNTLRPQAVKALEGLIHECDSGLMLQMQKFATFNERLLLGNGMCISPLDEQGDGTMPSRSLREVVNQIDNDHDLRTFVTGFSSKVGPKQPNLDYRRHPTLHNTQSPPPQAPPTSLRAPLPATNFQNHEAPSLGMTLGSTTLQSGNYQQASLPSFNVGPPDPRVHSVADPSPNQQSPVTNSAQPTASPASLPQVPAVLQHHEQAPLGKGSEVPFTSQGIAGQNPVNGASSSLSSKPVFGTSLENLFQRDGSAVPMVVYQCLQAVDMFGLDVEGIYRISGTASHISQLRSMFDHDSTQVDFRNPESFMHDVNSVAGLLKQFFRDLPDPLFTKEHYQTFIDAARIDDDITRRDSLHATINSLPDPNYATLRALTLHLHRVQEHSTTNRMTSANLAICFGPTLMVSGSPPAIADAGWQVRVIDTILQNTFQIFDDD